MNLISLDTESLLVKFCSTLCRLGGYDHISNMMRDVVIKIPKLLQGSVPGLPLLVPAEIPAALLSHGCHIPLATAWHLLLRGLEFHRKPLALSRPLAAVTVCAVLSHSPRVVRGTE